MTSKQSFRDWIASKLGTTMWVVARRSVKLESKGYKVFLSQRRFYELQREWEAR